MDSKCFFSPDWPSQKEARAILNALRTYAVTCFLDVAITLVQLLQSSSFAKIMSTVWVHVSYT